MGNQALMLSVECCKRGKSNGECQRAGATPVSHVPRGWVRGKSEGCKGEGAGVGSHKQRAKKAVGSLTQREEHQLTKSQKARQDKKHDGFANRGQGAT